MSAYIVDPRTVDYMISWLHRGTRGHVSPTVRRVWDSWEEVPEELQHATNGDERFGYGLNLIQVNKSTLGRIIMAENVRSVWHRYSEPGHRQYWREDHGMNDVPPDDLPGPNDQTRVWNYQYRPTMHYNPAWVVKACDCWEYQSCETGELQETLAYKIVQAIREDAIGVLTEDAPWGISQSDLEVSEEVGA